MWEQIIDALLACGIVVCMASLAFRSTRHRGLVHEREAARTARVARRKNQLIQGSFAWGRYSAFRHEVRQDYGALQHDLSLRESGYQVNSLVYLADGHCIGRSHWNNLGLEQKYVTARAHGGISSWQ